MMRFIQKKEESFLLVFYAPDLKLHLLGHPVPCPANVHGSPPRAELEAAAEPYTAARGAPQWSLLPMTDL